MARAAAHVQEQLRRILERLDALDASVAAVHRELRARPAPAPMFGDGAPAPPPPPPPPSGGRRAPTAAPSAASRAMGYMAELKQVLRLRRAL
jgi:hypothetical protein